MDQLVTIMTFTFAHETAVVRTLLESEGIPTFVLNDYTAQTISMYSNAIGGVHVQIPKTHFELAQNILIEKGFMKIDSDSKSAPKWLIKFDELSSNWPIFKNYSPEFRLFFLIAISVSILTVFLFFNTKN